MTDPINLTPGANPIRIEPDILEAEPKVLGLTEEVPKVPQAPQEKSQVDLTAIEQEELGAIALRLMNVMAKDKAGGLSITGAFNRDGKEYAYGLDVVITALTEVPAEVVSE